MRDGSKIFVKIDEYKEVLNTLNMLKSKLGDARENLNRINELKNEEDAELDTWHTELEEVERKVEHIDKALFEPDTL